LPPKAAQAHTAQSVYRSSERLTVGSAGPWGGAELFWILARAWTLTTTYGFGLAD